MAQGQYEKLYNTLKSGVLKGSTSSSTSTKSKLQNQIDNYTTRLNSSGVDTSSVEDDRNSLEKALNLDKNQGLLFDIFEVLGRPQQALFGAIENSQKGESAGEGALEGLKGNKETQFKDILTNAGMSDTKGKLDLSDVLGFAGDVFLDPLDLVPVAGFSKFGDALKSGEKLTDAAKNLKSTSDLLIGGTIKGAKEGAKLADKGIEKGLETIDNLNGITYKATNTNQIANMGKEIAEDATSKVGKLETYKDIKDMISKSFNYNKNVSKDVAQGLRDSSTASNVSALELKKIADDNDNAFKTYATNVAKKTGANVEDVTKKANEDVRFYIENSNMYKNGVRTDNAYNVVKDGINGNIRKGQLDKSNLKVLEDFARDVNDAELGYTLTIKEKDGVLEFNNGWKRALEENTLDIPSMQDTSLNLKSTLTNQQKHKLKLLDDEYKSGKDFTKLVDDVKDTYNKSNEILNKNFGLNINDKDGDNLDYIRHTQNKENMDAYKELMDINKSGDNINSATNTIGNTQTLSHRDIKGSIDEVNNYYKDQLKANWDSFDKEQRQVAKKIMDEGVFKNGYTDAFSDYLEDVPKTAKYGKDFDTVMTKAAFGDYEKLNKIEQSIGKAENAGDTVKLETLYKEKAQLLDNSNIKVLTKRDSEIPRGYVKLDKEQVENLAKKSETLAKQLGIPEIDKFTDFIKNNGSSIAINNEMYRLIDISSDEKQAKGLARIYDKYLSTFKKYKVLSPSFQFNNIVGNTSNIYLSGINATEQARLYPKAVDALMNGNDLVKARAAGETLTDAQNKLADLWTDFNKAGFGNLGDMTSLDLNEMPDSLKKYFNGQKSFSEMDNVTKVKDFLPYINNKMNQQFDTLSRFVVFMKGTESPSYLSRLNVDNAGDAVRKVLFDPSELTSFEQDTMKKLVPFYTFTKKNLAYQIDNLSKNGGQYTRLMKGYNSLLNDATGGNNENVSDWLKNNLYVPIPSLGEDGSYKVLRVQLPFGNLIDTVDDPLGAATSLVTPLARVPLELETGVNSYTGRDIEDYAGEKSSTIPFLTKKQEYLLGNLTGLDAPLKAGYRAYSGIQDTMNNGGNIMDSIGNGLQSSVTLSQSVDNDELTQMYDRLNKLEDLVSKYKDEVGDLPTMAELKSTNTNTKVSNILKTISKLNGVTSNPYKTLNNNILKTIKD